MPELAVFVAKRALEGLVVIWAIVTVVFVMEHAPGAPNPIQVILGTHYTPQAYQQLTQQYGLNLSGWDQYLAFLGMAPILSHFGVHLGHGPVHTGLIQGNLGLSYQYPGTPVWSILKSGVPVTLKLGLYALVVSLLVGIPIGMWSALHQNSWMDQVSETGIMVLYAIPTMVLVPLLQYIFAIRLQWLPVQGWGQNLSQLVLPVAAYAAGLAGYFAKSFRSFMLDVLEQDYIRTAEAEGLTRASVVWHHAMKNTLVPLASVVGPTIAYLIVGAFIIEQFFNIPGIANLTINSVFAGDYGVIEGTTIVLAAFVVLVNMLTDVFYTLVDPRVAL